MNEFKFLKPLWWVLHIIMIPFMFWLGHFVGRF
jgi:hypothetical protein